MELEAEYLIESIGAYPDYVSDKMQLEKIVTLATKLDSEGIIYLYHLTKALDRIALQKTEGGLLEIAVHGHGGNFVKNIDINELLRYLENFEDVSENPTEYGLKPDWE